MADSDWGSPAKPVPVTPAERAKALGAGDWANPASPVAVHKTPEQYFEGAREKLPKAIRKVAPNTMGEAGYLAGSTPGLLRSLAAIGTEAAPETEGLSLMAAAPLLTSMAMGALQDPSSVKNALKGAGWEGTKSLIAELAGRLQGKMIEGGAGFANKQGYYTESGQRVGKSIPDIFNEFPGDADDIYKLRSIEELRDQIGGGKVAKRAGARLGQFREDMGTKFGPYKPEVKPELVSPSSGVAAHYTAGSPASGRSVTIPTEDGSMKTMSIPEAMDEVRTMFGGGRSATGAQKSSAGAPELLDRAVKARDLVSNAMNDAFPGEKLGDKYRGHEKDVGIAKQLQKVFTSPTRDTAIRGGKRAVIDQPKVKAAAERAAAKLNQISDDAGTKLTKAVAPTGTAAVHEIPYSEHIKAGHGFHAYLKPPYPMKPETRAMMGPASRFFSDPRLSAAYGYILRKLAESGQ